MFKILIIIILLIFIHQNNIFQDNFTDAPKTSIIGLTKDSAPFAISGIKIKVKTETGERLLTRKDNDFGFISVSRGYTNFNIIDDDPTTITYSDDPRKIEKDPSQKRAILIGLAAPQEIVSIELGDPYISNNNLKDIIINLYDAEFNIINVIKPVF